MSVDAAGMFYGSRFYDRYGLVFVALALGAVLILPIFYFL